MYLHVAKNVSGCMGSMRVPSLDSRCRLVVSYATPVACVYVFVVSTGASLEWPCFCEVVQGTCFRNRKPGETTA